MTTELNNEAGSGSGGSPCSASFNTPVYSLFVLHDDQTWEQPSFQIVSANKLTEHDIGMIAESYFGGFISYGLQEDDDCDSDYVTTIYWPNTESRHPAETKGDL